jgi:hypothetical protein
MKVGTLCFATTRGLGYLAKDFYQNGTVTHPAVLNHGRIPTNLDWYPKGTPYITRKPYLNDELRALIDKVDAMLFFETPFDWNIVRYCREKGVKSVLLTMYECTPEKLPEEPDWFFCPSKLDLQYFPKDKSVFIPVPTEMDWKRRTVAQRFVHNAGHVGLKGRNGTFELLRAMRLVKSPIELTVRCQDVQKLRKIVRDTRAEDDARIRFDYGTIPFEELYDGFDVCVAPEKWNGMSYPLQEAHAAGLLVMTTDRWPANDWLPSAPLFDKGQVVKTRVASGFNEIDQCLLDENAIADTIDKFWNKDISDYSERGRKWGEQNSWRQLRSQYLDYLEAICQSRL